MVAQESVFQSEIYCVHSFQDFFKDLEAIIVGYFVNQNQVRFLPYI